MPWTSFAIVPKMGNAFLIFWKNFPTFQGNFWKSTDSDWSIIICWNFDIWYPLPLAVKGPHSGRFVCLEVSKYLWNIIYHHFQEIFLLSSCIYPPLWPFLVHPLGSNDAFVYEYFFQSLFTIERYFGRSLAIFSTEIIT